MALRSDLFATRPSAPRSIGRSLADSLTTNVTSEKSMPSNLFNLLKLSPIGLKDVIRKRPPLEHILSYMAFPIL